MCMLTGKPGQEARLPSHCPSTFIARRRLAGRTADFARAASILMALGSAAIAQDAPSGGDDAKKQTPEQVISVLPGGKVTMHVAALPLSDAVRMLSEPTKRNII